MWHKKTSFKFGRGFTKYNGVGDIQKVKTVWEEHQQRFNGMCRGRAALEQEKVFVGKSRRRRDKTRRMTHVGDILLYLSAVLLLWDCEWSWWRRDDKNALAILHFDFILVSPAPPPPQTHSALHSAHKSLPDPHHIHNLLCCILRRSKTRMINGGWCLCWWSWWWWSWAALFLLNGSACGVPGRDILYYHKIRRGSHLYKYKWCREEQPGPGDSAFNLH